MPSGLRLRAMSYNPCDLQGANLEVSLARLLWTQKHYFGPSARSGHAVGFDPDRNRVVLFGGVAAAIGNPATALAGDTWEWDGENWTQVDAMGPSARTSLAVAYDRNRNRLVLFGGSTANGPSGETWEWDGQDWTQVSETGPQARILHAIAFDSSKNVVTLFGGQLQQGDPSQETSYLNDTWEWDGQNWTQQEDTGPNRCGHTMAYDDNRQRLVLFGGNDALNQWYGDTWEWDGTTWTQRADFGCPPRTGASLVFTGGECVLFGGTGSTGPQKQTWTWDGTYWTARQDIGPSARSGHAAAFDSGRRVVVLFGGLDQTQSPLGDTWEQNAELLIISFSVELQTVADGVLGSANFQLSAPAPANGAVITLSVPQDSGLTFVAGTPVEGMFEKVPAGQTTLDCAFRVSLIAQVPNSVTFTATLQNGNSLQAVASMPAQ